MLVVDAAQGIEAQTLANAYLALDANLDDHPGRQQDRPARAPTRTRVAQEIEDVIGLDADDVLPGLGEGGQGHRASCSSASSSEVPPPTRRRRRRRCAR